MKVTKIQIAKAIHKDDKEHSFSSQKLEWEDLPFHRQLTYEVKAEQFIRVSKALKEEQWETSTTQTGDRKE